MIAFKKRKGIAGLCVIAAASMLFCGCGTQETEDNIIVVEHEIEEIAYDFGYAEIGNVYQREKYRCTYKQMNEQEVSFAISGKLVDKVHVKEGDSVTKGTLLAELTSEDLSRAIEDLEYNIKKNELQLQFLETNEANEISSMWVNFLYFTGQSSNDKKNLDTRIENLQTNNRYQREDIEDALTADRKALEQKKRDLRSSRVYAAIDGVVYKMKDRLRGTTSKSDEVIMTIIDTSECLFETNIENAASIFRENETVEMNLAYGAGAGQYELMPYKMEEWTEDRQLFSVFDGPESSGIEVGTSGTMTVVKERRENVLTVPVSAVHKADGKVFVYVLGADNMREVKWVEAGLFGEDTVEILSGLAEGEKVIKR